MRSSVLVFLVSCTVLLQAGCVSGVASYPAIPLQPSHPAGAPGQGSSAPADAAAPCTHVPADSKPCAACLCAASPGDSSKGAGEKVTGGAVERVSFPDLGDFVLEARVDTGAQTSSLHVTSWKPFERDGARWVSFVLPVGAGKKPLRLERPLSRIVRIKGRDESNRRRPVVQLKIRLGKIERTIEFTLADRGDFEFPALLGRNFLLDTVVVDVGRRFVLSAPPATGTSGLAGKSRSSS